MNILLQEKQENQDEDVKHCLCDKTRFSKCIFLLCVGRLEVFNFKKEINSLFNEFIGQQDKIGR